MSSDPKLNCGYDLLAIPDGFRVDDKGCQFLELSLLVTPAWDETGSLALPDWPNQISNLVAASANVRFRIGDNELPPIPARSELNEYLETLNSTESTVDNAKRPVPLWNSIFRSTLDGPTDWSELQSGLEEIADSRPTHRIDSLQSQTAVAKCETARVDVLLQELEELSSGQDPESEGFQVNRDVVRDILKGVREEVFGDQLSRRVMFGAREDFSARTSFSELFAALKSVEPTAAAHIAVGNRQAIIQDLSSAIPDLGPYPDEPEDPLVEEEDVVETALGKLMALKALPTIAHYFGLAVQLSVEVGRAKEILPANLDGLQVSATLGEIPPKIEAWTAVNLEFDEEPRFDPAHNGHSTPEFASVDGLLVQPDMKNPRYWLSERDPVNTLMTALSLLDDQDEFNRWFSNFGSKSKGISLFDSLSTKSLADEINATTSNVSDVHYAEDLAWGLRPDIGIVYPATEDHPEEIVWLSTTVREIRCDDLDGEFFSHEVIRRIAHRDHGLAFALEKKEGDDEADARTEFVSKTDEMFNWTGESLALSRALISGMRVDPLKMLNLNLQYNLAESVDPDDVRNMLPPLRTGVEYIVGCRIALQNGGGRRGPAPGQELYGEKNIIGMRSLDHERHEQTPIPLKYAGPVPAAPSIHLEEGSWLALERGDTHGDRVDQMVIRSEGGHGARINARSENRFLTPPRINFDEAESQGQFDDIDNPRSAFRRLLRAPETGAFPEVRKGRLYWWRIIVEDGEQKTVLERFDTRERVSPAEAGGSRGTVLVNSRSRDAEPTFIHAQARLLCSDFSQTQYVRFWAEDGAPSNSSEVKLRLKAVEEIEEPFALLNEDDRRRITAFLPPASTETVEFFVKHRLDVPSAKNSLRVTFVHATKKPLQKPVGLGGGFGIYPVTIDESRVYDGATSETDQIVNPISRAWREYVDDHIGDPLETWDGHVGGGLTYFVGRIGIHRRSTGSLSCLGTWNEYGPKSIRKDGSGLWTLVNKEIPETLFETVIDSESGNADAVDLLHNDTGDKLRALSFSFSDGRARKLDLRLRAVSSYKHYFPGGDIDENNQQFSEEQDIGAVWVKSTIRPHVPAIDRTIPVFNWEKSQGAKYRREMKRRTSYRVFLQDWYSSGEGEQLAIVMLPRNTTADDSVGADYPQLAVDPQNVCDYGVDDAFLEFMPRFSRDAALGSGRQPFIAEPEHFQKSPDDLINELPLFLGENRDPRFVREEFQNGGKKMEVSILPLTNNDGGFDPNIDPEMGPYFDIDLPRVSPDEAALDYWPFVHISLVRYQPHSVGNLQLSQPVQIQLQKLPDREILVTKSGNRKRKLVVSGDKPHAGAHQAPSLVLYAHLIEHDDRADSWSSVRSIRMEATRDDHNSLLYGAEFNVALNERAIVLEEYEEYPSGERRLIFSTMTLI